MKLTLTGVLDTQRVLAMVQEKMAKQGVRRAVRAGAEVISNAIEERAPVLNAKNQGSNALEPGALKADIGVRMKTEGGEPVAIIGPGSSTAHVARFVEYGHRQVSGGYSKVLGNGRVRGPGKVSSKDVPAYPFIRPAFEASAEEARDVFAVEAGKQLKEAVR